MPDPDSTGYFTDSDQLASALADERAADTLQLSTVADALAVVDAFRTAPAAPARPLPVTLGGPVAVSANQRSPWTSLDRATVADGVAAILRDPRSINQSALNLCGPAAFFNITAGRHPVAVARAAAALYNTGSCDLGSLHIAPRPDLMATNYAQMANKISAAGLAPSSQAEWMLLGALRNSMAVWWLPDWRGDPAQTVAGMTRPEEVAGWLRGTGFFSNVADGGRWATNAGIPNAMNLTLGGGNDNALLINANLLAAAGQTQFDNTFIMRSFPNHWVVLLSEVVPDVATGDLTVSLWTWGHTLTGLTIPQRAFLDNYYGAVQTRMRRPG